MQQLSFCAPDPHFDRYCLIRPGFQVDFYRHVLEIATAGFWAVGRWISHLRFDTPFVTEHELMLEFVAASLAGGRRRENLRIILQEEQEVEEDMKIREHLGISRRKQRQATRGMQLLLFGAVLGGFYLGKTGIIVNSLVSLVISFVPAFLRRDHEIVMDPALVLWMTSAVFFHAAGTYGPYDTIWWWDHFTHMLSASVVGAAGYATVLALENHREDIHFPDRFIFVFLLIFVMAFGVLWEVLEFAISTVAELTGRETILTQHGLEDMMKDLVFDVVGALTVAIFGEAYVSGLADQIREKMEK